MTTDPIAALFALDQFGIKFGLDNIAAIAAALGHPEHTYPAIHIAGTNGKGSVTAVVDAAMRAAGYRSARYTSPHLTDFAERFVIDGTPVSQDALRSAVSDVTDVVAGLRERGALVVQPTFFEVTTAVAFELFRRARVEVAVFEVGLGGRLDATNVITPIATAITSIARDHEQYLGHTLREIAREKAGIIKPGVPVVLGPLDADAREEIEAIALARLAPVTHVTAGPAAAAGPMHLHTPARDYGVVTPALPGAHQRTNAAIAAVLLEVVDSQGLRVPPSAIVHGIEHVSWPGRLEVRRLPDGREILLDAAHNPQGATALAAFLDAGDWRGRPLIFAAMRDKDLDGMLMPLARSIGRIIVTRASTPRSADPEDLAARIARIAPGIPVRVAASPDEAMAEAWRHSPRIVAAGSIFLLADVLNALGRA